MVIQLVITVLFAHKMSQFGGTWKSAKLKREKQFKQYLKKDYYSARTQNKSSTQYTFLMHWDTSQHQCVDMKHDNPS